MVFRSKFYSDNDHEIKTTTKLAPVDMKSQNPIQPKHFLVVVYDMAILPNNEEQN